MGPAVASFFVWAAVIGRTMPARGPVGVEMWGESKQAVKTNDIFKNALVLIKG